MGIRMNSSLLLSHTAKLVYDYSIIMHSVANNYYIQLLSPGAIRYEAHAVQYSLLLADDFSLCITSSNWVSLVPAFFRRFFTVSEKSWDVWV